MKRFFKVLPNLEIENKILRLSKLYVTKNNTDPRYLSEESLERTRFHPWKINGANSSAVFGLIS